MLLTLSSGGQPRWWHSWASRCWRRAWQLGLGHFLLDGPVGEVSGGRPSRSESAEELKGGCRLQLQRVECQRARRRVRNWGVSRDCLASETETMQIKIDTTTNNRVCRELDASCKTTVDASQSGGKSQDADPPMVNRPNQAPKVWICGYAARACRTLESDRTQDGAAWTNSRAKVGCNASVVRKDLEQQQQQQERAQFQLERRNAFRRWECRVR